MDRSWDERLTDNEKSRLNQPLMSDSAYNMKLKEEQQQRQIQEKVAKINEVRSLFDYAARGSLNFVDLMNAIEKLLHACGGEAKANFIEVTRDFMKIATRVPMKANLHTFLPENETSNPRFHKVVTQVLMSTPQIGGVRWIPNPDGTVLVISVEKN